MRVQSGSWRKETFLPDKRQHLRHIHGEGNNVSLSILAWKIPYSTIRLNHGVAKNLAPVSAHTKAEIKTDENAKLMKHFEESNREKLKLEWIVRWACKWCRIKGCQREVTSGIKIDVCEMTEQVWSRIENDNCVHLVFETKV